MNPLTFSGDIRAIGREEGKAYRDALERIIWGGAIPAALLSNHRTELSNFTRHLSACLPEEMDRIEAICGGAVLDQADLLSIWSRELGTAFSLAPPATSLIISLSYDRFSEGIPAIGVNIDTPIFLLPFFITRKYQPTNAFSSIELSMLTLAGAMAGVNEQGLAAALSLKPFEGDGNGAIPLSLIVREVLRRCKDTRGALKLVKSIPRGASGTIVLADSYSIVIVEMTPRALEAREVKHDFFVISGHFLLPTMMGRDLPHVTLWPQTAPPELAGKRVYETSERRVDRTWNLIDEKKAWDSQGLGDLLMDQEKGPRLISGFYKTFASTLLIPAKKTLFHAGAKKGKFTRIFL